MPLDFSAYRSRSVIAQVQVAKIAANVEVHNTQSGTASYGTDSTIQVLQGYNGSTNLPSGFVGDILDAEINAPVDADGSYPDALITIWVGTTQLKSFYLDGSYPTNMFPRAERLVGGPDRQVHLGESAYDLLTRAVNGAMPRNIPIRITGIKVPPGQTVSVHVLSAAGWGQSGAAINPLIVTLTGQIVQASDLVPVSAAYTGAATQFSVTREPFPILSGTHSIAGALGIGTWAQLPGGTAQTGNTINRKLLTSQNLAAIGTSGNYIMSNDQAVGGSPNNVPLNQDLGDEASGQHAFIWEEFGIAFAASLFGAGDNPQAYVGFWVDNAAMVPGANQNGYLISGVDNPFAYGAVYPQRAASGLYYALPSVKRLMTVLSWGHAVTPAVSAAGLTQLAAQTIAMVKGGVDIIFAGGQG